MIQAMEEAMTLNFAEIGGVYIIDDMRLPQKTVLLCFCCFVLQYVYKTV